jgi:hypothetical protein
MKNINNQFAKLLSGLTEKRIRLVVMMITIALFILSAGAPNATIGIGK